jgi:Spy/CpxP family protein refolding chaperone
MAVMGIMGASVAQAGSGCCPAKKAKAECKVEAKQCGVDSFDMLDLTDEQRDQMAELKAEFGDGEWSEETCEAYMEGLHEILTEEQVAKCKSVCDEKGWKCPSSAKKGCSDTKG